jgi:formylglycine-generating enzyme required for sulfatase activity
VPSFYLDCTEATVAQVRKLGLTSARSTANDNDAANEVSWDQAVAYAEQIGKRLPNEIEYEFAATAGGTRDYPWGDDAKLKEEWTYGPAGEPAWDRTDTDPPVYGLYSNVAEWTSTWFTRYPTQAKLAPYHANWNSIRAIRGGTTGVAWRDPVRLAEDRQWEAQGFWSPRYRPGFDRTDSLPGLGFRCARSVRPPFLD